MVFGVFDIIHNGHRHFLREAKKLGKNLVTILPPDAAVMLLKGHLPHHTLSERVKNLEREALADVILSGDDISESWQIVKNIRPDIIALGYDQQKLGEALRQNFLKTPEKVKIVSITPYKDSSLHSNTLRKNIV